LSKIITGTGQKKTGFLGEKKPLFRPKKIYRLKEDQAFSFSCPPPPPPFVFDGQ
jgi:hypothetical protein